MRKIRKTWVVKVEEENGAYLRGLESFYVVRALDETEAAEAVGRDIYSKLYRAKGMAETDFMPFTEWMRRSGENIEDSESTGFTITARSPKRVLSVPTTTIIVVLEKL